MKKLFSFWIVFLLAVVSVEAKQKPRSFYLTVRTFTGSHALTACTDGYHMASLYEIFDVSNFKYDATLGFTSGDSGFGPPSNEGGWIRTGYDAITNTSTPGQTNCYGWTDDSSQVRGTLAFLSSAWDYPPFTIIDPWFTGALPCSEDAHVWCVQD